MPAHSCQNRNFLGIIFMEASFEKLCFIFNNFINNTTNNTADLNEQ